MSLEVVKIYQVGGSVRDEVMGRPAHDIDYAVEVSSFDILIKWIKENNGEILHSKPEFASVKIRWRPKQHLKDSKDSKSMGNKTTYVADFTMCRKDGDYTDGRHPSTIEAGTLLNDLSRRDFTMNAMARRCKFDPLTCTISTVLSEPIIDPFDGQKHILQKRIVSVGDAKERAKEDTLRVLRALRFSICFGFEIEPQIQAAIQCTPISKSVSKERIAEELNKCFQHDTIKTLNMLQQYPFVSNQLFQNNNFTLRITK